MTEADHLPAPAAVPVSYETGWKVMRHGGAGTHVWRCIFRGDSRSASMRFDRVAEDMRQGGVRLVDPLGVVASEARAPRHRLRSKW